MTLSQATLDKVAPFVNHFDAMLNTALTNINNKLSFKGLGESGFKIISYQDIFLNLLNELTNRIGGIVFNDIRNGVASKPAFSELKSYIEEQINPLTLNFKNNFFEPLVKGVLSNPVSVNEVNLNFEAQLKSNLAMRFVILEQEFDSL